MVGLVGDGSLDQSVGFLELRPGCLVFGEAGHEGEEFAGFDELFDIGRGVHDLHICFAGGCGGLWWSVEGLW